MKNSLSNCHSFLSCVDLQILCQKEIALILMPFLPVDAYNKYFTNYSKNCKLLHTALKALTHLVCLKRHHKLLHHISEGEAVVVACGGVFPEPGPCVCQGTYHPLSGRQQHDASVLQQAVGDAHIFFSWRLLQSWWNMEEVQCKDIWRMLTILAYLGDTPNILPLLTSSIVTLSLILLFINWWGIHIYEFTFMKEISTA